MRWVYFAEDKKDELQWCARQRRQDLDNQIGVHYVLYGVVDAYIAE